MKPDKKTEADLIELGKFYFLNQNYAKAAKEFEKVIETNPKNAEAYYNLGIVKEAQNDITAAKKMFEKVLALQPNHKSAKEHLSKIVGIKKK